MNPFSLEFHDRLRAWHDLRETLLANSASVDVMIECVMRFWNNCPLDKHYLHPVDIEDWPSPWELLNDNVYCHYAKALGIFYTFKLLDIQSVDLAEGVDDNNETVILVLVDDRVLNCSNTSTEIKNISTLNTTKIKYR